jgi:hypothetical protein
MSGDGGWADRGNEPDGSVNRAPSLVPPSGDLGAMPPVDSDAGVPPAAAPDAGAPVGEVADAGVAPDGGAAPVVTPDGGAAPVVTPDGGAAPVVTPDGGAAPVVTPDGGVPPANVPDAAADGGKPPANRADAGTPPADTPDGGEPPADEADAGTPAAGTPDGKTQMPGKGGPGATAMPDAPNLSQVPNQPDVSAVPDPAGASDLIAFELAEHEAWASAGAAVGGAESTQRAGFIADAVGGGMKTGLATGATSGVIMGFGSAAVGRLAARRIPVPVVGAIIGGAIGAAGLYNTIVNEPDKFTGAVGKIGQGSSGYDAAANTIEGIMAILDLAANIIDTVALVTGVIAAIAWAAAIPTFGASSPIAIQCTLVATKAALVSAVLSMVKAALGPLVLLFRALHSFTTQADPREVQVQGRGLSDAAKGVGGFVGAMAGAAVGSKMGEKAGKRISARFPPAETPKVPTGRAPEPPAVEAKRSPILDKNGRPFDVPQIIDPSTGRPFGAPAPGAVGTPSPILDSSGRPMQGRSPIVDANGIPYGPGNLPSAPPAPVPSPILDPAAPPAVGSPPLIVGRGQPARPPGPIVDATGKPYTTPGPSPIIDPSSGQPFRDRPGPLFDASGRPLESSPIIDPSTGRPARSVPSPRLVDTAGRTLTQSPTQSPIVDARGRPYGPGNRPLPPTRRPVGPPLPYDPRNPYSVKDMPGWIKPIDEASEAQQTGELLTGAYERNIGTPQAEPPGFTADNQPFAEATGGSSGLFQTSQEAADTRVERVNPKYPTPPGTLADLASYIDHEQRLRALAAEARADAAKENSSRQISEDRQQDLDRIARFNAELAAARGAHDARIASTRAANERKQQTEQRVGDQANQAGSQMSGILTLTPLLYGYSLAARGFGAVLGIFSDSAEAKAQASAQDADKFLVELGKVRATIAAEQAAAPGRAARAQAEGQAVAATAQQGQQTDAQAAKNAEAVSTTKAAVAQDAAAAQSAYDRAIADAEKAEAEADKQKADHDTLQAELAIWAELHREARAAAVNDTVAALTAKGYTITRKPEQ